MADPSLSMKHPPVPSEESDADIVQYPWESTLDISPHCTCQSSSLSWITHRESIQAYRTPNSRVITTKVRLQSYIRWFRFSLWTWAAAGAAAMTKYFIAFTVMTPNIPSILATYFDIASPSFPSNARARYANPFHITICHDLTLPSSSTPFLTTLTTAPI